MKIMHLSGNYVVMIAIVAMIVSLIYLIIRAFPDSHPRLPRCIHNWRRGSTIALEITPGMRDLLNNLSVETGMDRTEIITRAIGLYAISHDRCKAGMSIGACKSEEALDTVFTNF